MMRESFIRGGDFEELCLRKRAADEFHTDRQLGRGRSDKLASVGVRRIRHPIINDSGKSGRDDYRRKSAFRAQVDTPTAARAPEHV